MKRLTLIALLTLSIDICLAQSFDVENERLSGISTLTIKSFNGCCAKKGFRADYFFNEKGQAIKSEHFFRLQKRAVYEYQYDSIGNLTREIQTYSINDKIRIDTTITNQYDYDSKKSIINKTKRTSSEHFWTEIYSDFNDFNKPQKVFSYSSLFPDTSIQILEYNQNGQLTKILFLMNDSLSFPDTSIQILEYNQNGQLSKILFLKNDSLRTSEILDYNIQGDLSYSLIPSIVGKENEPLAIWVGGSRHAPEERYEYTYDRQNRWTRKYVLYKKKKVLLEKRNYK